MPLEMDTGLAERDYKMISAGGAYQEESAMEEESEESLHKLLNGRFTTSHVDIGCLATARAELGVSIYLNHMLAEDVWVRRFRGGENEAIIYNFDEARVREEQCHQCWGWSTSVGGGTSAGGGMRRACCRDWMGQDRSRLQFRRCTHHARTVGR